MHVLDTSMHWTHQRAEHMDGCTVLNTKHIPDLNNGHILKNLRKRLLIYMSGELNGLKLMAWNTIFLIQKLIYSRFSNQFYKMYLFSAFDERTKLMYIKMIMVSAMFAKMLEWTPNFDKSKIYVSEIFNLFCPKYLHRFFTIFHSFCP